MRRGLALVALIAVAACVQGGGPNIGSPPFAAMPAPKPLRSNAAMSADILDLTFALESGREVAQMTRFEGPVRLRLAGEVPASLSADLSRLLARLRTEAGIEIRQTDDSRAEITIEAVPSALLHRAAPGAACFTVPEVDSWRSYALADYRAPDWASLTARRQVTVFLPSDAAPQEVRSCLHEELAQALGPLNDLYRLPDSVFNDDDMEGTLTGFDMLALRALYAPELRSGMSRSEVAARLPAILARLNPSGGSDGAAQVQDDGSWRRDIETALSPANSPTARIDAAARAAQASQRFAAGDPRAGFGPYVYGRQLMSRDPAEARRQLDIAARAYGQSALTAIQAAHVAAQLARLDLASGDAATARDRARAARDVATAHEDAALYAELALIDAEALDRLGDTAAAKALRLDSQPVARYGFGSDTAIGQMQRALAALGPAKEN
jgi:hypothetical protein